MKKFEDLEIHFHLSIGYAAAHQEDSEPLSNYFSEDEWNALNERQKEMAISDITQSWAENYMEVSGWVE